MRDPARALQRADDLLSRGVELSRAGRHARAEAALRGAVRRYQQVLERASGVFVADHEIRARSTGGLGLWGKLGLALWRLANAVAARGDLGQAVGYCSEAAERMRTEMDRPTSPLHPRDDSLRTRLAVCLTDLSLFRCANGSPYPEEAVRAAEDAVALLNEPPESHGRGYFQPAARPREGSEQELATAYHALAQAHLAAGARRDADVAIRSALLLREPAADAEPGATLASYELASSLLLRTRILLAGDGNRPKAEGALDRAGALLAALGDTGAPLTGELARLRRQLDL